MANSEKINLNILASIKGVEKKNLFFEHEQIFIYSPGIQSNSTNSSKDSLDISRDTFKRLFDVTKSALIVIRYYRDFLLLPVDDVKEFIDLENDTRNKWSFKTERLDDMTLEMKASKSGFCM